MTEARRPAITEAPPNPSGTAHDLLTRWLELSELERRSFVAMVRELTSTSSVIEHSAIDLSARFQTLAASATAQMERVDAIVAIAKSIDVAGKPILMSDATQFIEGVLIRVIDTVLAVSKHAMRMVYSLDDIASEVAGAEKCVKQIHAINQQTRFLALNAAIEAERAGTGGAAFQVIAREIRELSNTTAEVSKVIGGQIASVARGVRRGHDMLAEIATMDLSEHIRAKQRLDDMLAGLLAQNAAFTTILGETAQASAELSSTIAPMIMGMQFQDRTSQHLSHMIEALVVLGQATEALQQATHAAMPGRFAIGEIDAEWLDRILDGQTLGAVRKRFLAQLLGNPEAAEDEVGAHEDIELF